MLLRARSRQANSPSPRGDEEGVSFQQRFRWGLLEPGRCDSQPLSAESREITGVIAPSP
jgi:hypothetical protein